MTPRRTSVLVAASVATLWTIGAGHVLLITGKLVQSAVGVDRSREMLNVARSNLFRAGLRSLDDLFEIGDKNRELQLWLSRKRHCYEIQQALGSRRQPLRWIPTQLSRFRPVECRDL